MNNNPLITIYGGVLLRYLLAIIFAHLGIEKAEQEKLMSPEAIGYLLVAITTISYGVYRTLMRKLKQKQALEMPKGTSQEHLNEVVKDLGMKAILTTNPKA